MSNEIVTYRPRNDKVVLKLHIREKWGGVHVPQKSLEGQRWLVVAVGPKVEDLEVGDEVLIGGKEKEDWAFIPGSSELAIIHEVSILAVVHRKTDEVVQ